MRTNAEINLKVNARALGDLERAMEDAFDPTRVRDTEGAVGQLNEELEDAGGSARSMAEGLDQAARSREDFKRLRQELRGVRQEAARMNRELQRTAQLMQRVGMGGGGGGAGGGMGGGGGFRRQFRPMAQHTEQTPGAVSGRPVRTSGGGSGDKTSQGYDAMAAGLASIPYAGLALGAFLSLGGQAYNSHITREGARRKSYAARHTAGGSSVVSAGAIEGVGQSFGYKPAEAMGMYDQFMSQAGRGIGTSQFRTAMGIQQTYGVDLGSQGALIQAGRRAGGGRSIYGSTSAGMDQLTTALRRAVQLGLDGSELRAYMQQTTQIVAREAELGATNLDMSGYRSAELAMAGRVGGFQAQRMTSAFAQGVSSIGYKGAGDATEFQLAQIAGYRPGDGTDAYFEALQQMQDVGENPEMMADFLQSYVSPDAGKHTNIAMVQRAYQAVTGQELHADTAERFISGDRTSIRDMVGEGTLDDVRGVHGDLKVEADFEKQRADIGRDVAEAMQEVTASTLELSRLMADFAPIVELAATGLRGLAMGAGEIMELIEPLFDAIQKLTDWIQANLG